MTGRHLADDELADLDADLLDPVEADEARAHLATCPECADRFAELGELRSLLRADDPGPMPDDLVARLESALAEAGAAPRFAASSGAATTAGAAASSGAGISSTTAASSGTGMTTGTAAFVGAGASGGSGGAGGSGGTGGSGATVTPLHRERRVPAWLSAAAAIAVVVGVGALGVRALGGSNSGTSSSSGGMSSGAGAPQAARGSAPGVAPTASGRDYSPATVAADTRLLLSGGGPAPDVRGSAPESAPADGSTPTALAGLSGSGLAACVGQLSDGTPQRPLAVDLASWQGSPAAVIVLPAATADPAYVDVWVVGPACGGPGGADVRHFQRVQR